MTVLSSPAAEQAMRNGARTLMQRMGHFPMIENHPAFRE